MTATDKTFKILSIDGGGIKGLYSLYLLQEFDNEFCKPNGKKIVDYFDMICGTSTGGIIALSLAHGISVDEIIKVYETNAKDIFPYHNSPFYYKPYIFARCMFWSIMGCKYDNVVLKNISDKLFGDTTLGDLKKIVCVPSYCINTGSNTVFKTPHPEFLKCISNPIDKNIKLTDVVLSTSSAPTYFPIHYLKSDSSRDGYYIDGGIWANNPSMIGVMESLRFFVGKNKQYDNYSLLSIGNIQQNKTIIPNYFWGKYWSLWKIPNLISTFFDSNTQSVHHWCDQLTQYTNSKYVRLSSNEYNLNGLTNMKLDDSNEQSLDNLRSNAKNYASRLIMKNSEESNKKNVHQFFESLATYKF